MASKRVLSSRDFTLRLSPYQYNKLKKLKKDSGRSLTGVIRRLIETSTGEGL